MTRIGYARVSTSDQNPDSQRDALTAAGCEKIFTDRASGKLARRPQWDACLAFLRPGDTLVITRLSRAARSLRNLLDVAAQLREHDVDLLVLKQDIDTTTPAGRLVFHLMAAIDEFQRDLIVEGTREGLAAARARGHNGGRPAKLSDDQVQLAGQLADAREHTMQQIADMFGVTKPTLYRHLERARQAQASPTPATGPAAPSSSPAPAEPGETLALRGGGVEVRGGPGVNSMMFLTITERLIRSTETRHTAAAKGDVWEVTWLPGQALTREQATRAMLIAQAADSGMEPADPRWPRVNDWAAALGLDGPVAVGKVCAAADAAEARKLSRGLCPACRADVALRKNGTVREHPDHRHEMYAVPGAVRDGIVPTCTGSGKRPR